MTTEATPNPPTTSSGFSPDQVDPAFPPLQCGRCPQLYYVLKGSEAPDSRKFIRDMAFQKHALEAHPELAKEKPQGPPSFVGVQAENGQQIYVNAQPNPQPVGAPAPQPPPTGQPMNAEQARLAAMQQAGFAMPQPANAAAPGAPQGPPMPQGWGMTSEQMAAYIQQHNVGTMVGPTVPYQAGRPPQVYTGPGGVGGQFIADSASDRSPSNGMFVGGTPQGGGGLSHHNAHLFQQPMPTPQHFGQALPVGYAAHQHWQTPPPGMAPHQYPQQPVSAHPQSGYGAEQVFQGVDGKVVNNPNVPQSVGPVFQGTTPPVIQNTSFVHRATNGTQEGGSMPILGPPATQGRSQNAPGGDPTMPQRPMTYAPTHIDPHTGQGWVPPPDQNAPYGYIVTPNGYYPAPPPPTPPMLPAPQQAPALALAPATPAPQEDPLLEALSASELLPLAAKMLREVLDGLDLEKVVTLDDDGRKALARKAEGAARLLKTALKK